MDNPIPFIDLTSDWRPLKNEVLRRIEKLFDHAQFIMGPEVMDLERQLAENVGTSYALTCSSGTMALQLALMALGIGRGDEVIIPAFTFAAPAEAIVLLGATPVLADICPDTLNMSVDSCAALIGPRTRAIIAVSLFGQPADFGRLTQLARQHGISVIEDAAQSYGATLDGRRSGSLADLGCTSFFPTKPFGGAGEGGALFTNDPDMALRIRQARDHGQSGKYMHASLGTNGRMDSLSCCALLAALPRLEQQIARRQALAQVYDRQLREDVFTGRLQLPGMLANARSAYAQYAVLLDGRDRVADRMWAAGIEVAVHYPTPLHRQPFFAERVRLQSLVHSENAALRILCLPLYPTLSEEQIGRVTSTLVAALDI